MNKISSIGFVAILFVAALIIPHSALALTAPAGFQVETYVSGLNLPTSFSFAPDGRIFVAEKSGKVRLVKNGALVATPVYTIPHLNDYGDHGLIGIAVDPLFAQNGYLYLAYTYENNPADYTGPKTGQIIRVTVVGDTASESSKVVLAGKIVGDATKPSCDNFPTTADCIPSDAITHSVGGLRFGPDGKLYAALGDGAGFLSMDPKAMRALNIDSLGGKLLRINKNGTAPIDNPFYNGDPNANRSKVWAMGLRNGFRFNFRPANNSLYLGDVGWYTWEELDVVPKGANLGWPCREGRVQVPEYSCVTTNYTDPVYVYDHSPGSGAIAGGTFPTNSVYPADYMNQFYMADFAQNWIKRVKVDANDKVLSVDNFIDNADGPVDIQTGLGGKIYYASIYKGELRRINYSTSTTSLPPPPPPATSTPPAGPTAAKPHFVSMTVAPTPSYIGSESTVTATIRNDGAADPVTVKMYLFDPAGTEIGYKYYERQTIPSGGTSNFDMTWMPPSLGDFTIKVGLFTPDWQLLEWTDKALIVSVVDRSPGTTTTPIAPALVSTTVNPSTGGVGTARTVSASVKNNGGAGSMLVDLEIYNGATKVAQKYFDSESFTAGQTRSFDLAYTPTANGDYKVSVGLFKPNWASLYSWTDTAATLSVGGNPPPPPPPPPPSGTVIYQDALTSGWENWSWDTTVDTASTEFVREGSKSIKVKYNSAWAGFFLHNAGFNTSGKTSLKISLNGGSPIGEQALQIIPYDSTGKALAPVKVDAYKGGTKLNANSWSDIVVPLKDLGIENTTITGFVIQGRDGQVQEPYYVDNVRIE